MGYRFTFLLAASALATGIAAQNVRLNVFGGYTFQDKLSIGGSYGGYTFNEARISEGQHFGGSIEFDVRPNKAVELLFQQQNADGYLTYGGGLADAGPFDIRLHYIMLGGLGYAPFSDAVSGYGGFSIGASYVTGDASDTKFAWGGKLGLKINVSETVALKAGAQILSPVQGAGGGFYFGTGGAGAGVSTYSSIYQFAFTGGLCFTLPRRGGGGASPASTAPPAPAPGYGVPPPPPPPPPRN